MTTLQQAQIVKIGRVASPHGVHGWVKIHSYTEPAGNILDYPVWYLKADNAWERITIAESRATKQGIILVRLDGFDNREQAASYTNKEIAIRRDEMPALAAGQYYWIDLIGLTVINRQNYELGIVDKLLNNGAHDVLVVKGTKKYLIPYVKEHYIIKVDLEEKTILVDWNEDD